MEALVTLGIMLGVGEATKLLDEASISPAEASKIANKIILAAKNKNNQLLTKVTQMINNIPQLAGSPSVKSYLSKVRQGAEDLGRRVEKDMGNLEVAAQDAADKINSEASKSWLKKGWDFINTGKTTSDRVNEVSSDFGKAEQGVIDKYKNFIGDNNEKKN